MLKQSRQVRRAKRVSLSGSISGHKIHAELMNWLLESTAPGFIRPLSTPWPCVSFRATLSWLEQLEIEVLPALSMANVREMLQAVLPLKQLLPEQATRLVVKHLVKRTRSISSRLKAQRRKRGPT